MKTRSQIGHLFDVIISLCYMFPSAWGTKCFKSHGGAKIKFVGRHLMLWGMWEKVKTVGELGKSWGS